MELSLDNVVSSESEESGSASEKVSIEAGPEEKSISSSRSVVFRSRSLLIVSQKMDSSSQNSSG